MIRKFCNGVGALACATVLSVGVMPSVEAATANPLAGTDWRLVAFQSMDDAIGTLKPEPSRYTLRLNRDGTFAMHLNCNLANGTWSAEPSGRGDGGRFEFSPLAMTHALCPPPSIDERIAAQSGFVRSYQLKDGRLHLILMADGGVLIWEPDPMQPAVAGVPASPEEGGPRNWQVSGVSSVLNLRARPSTAAAIVTSLPPGTILDNLGCEQAAGRAWCDVQKFGGGPRGYAAAEFLKPALSPDGIAATGPDDSALRAGQGIFDAKGSIPCSQGRGQPMTTCEYGVARAGGGYATVVVKRPQGGTRTIHFRMGVAVGADTSQADGYGAFSATRAGDLHSIRVGDERYEIHYAVILGG